LRKLLMVLIGAIALATGGTALAKSSSTAPASGADDFAAFRTPSGNIGCAYTGAGGSTKGYLRCDIGTGLKPRPRKPASCQLDYGSGYEMSDTGRAKVVCAGDTVLRQGFVLRYGKTWRRGGFTCASRLAGLRCTNRSARGFFLSRARSYLI
jgi:hypothetical protein